MIVLAGDEVLGWPRMANCDGDMSGWSGGEVMGWPWMASCDGDTELAMMMRMTLAIVHMLD